MKGYSSLLKRLKEIKDMGYIKTHRAGSTGIGKTLEDLLGIEENNISGPNLHNIELKSVRKNTSSMLTLFTKSPLPPKANDTLLKKFGYKSIHKTGKKELHSTISAKKINMLKGKPGFKIVIKRYKINLVTDKMKLLDIGTRTF
ncbi:MAG: MvaI/BcnI family restriction endonuclease [Candidatus Hydrogenedens sp.]